MIVCAAGGIHGGLDRHYAHVAAFEQPPRVQFAWVLQFGDIDVRPDGHALERPPAMLPSGWEALLPLFDFR